MNLYITSKSFSAFISRPVSYVASKKIQKIFILETSPWLLTAMQYVITAVLFNLIVKEQCVNGDNILVHISAVYTHRNRRRSEQKKKLLQERHSNNPVKSSLRCIPTSFESGSDGGAVTDDAEENV
jgi:hypothetical protein